MIEILRASPLLLLFAVAAIGYPLGRLRIGRSSLGIAAVLFVGLAFGALDPALQLPEMVYQLGLVLFVYTVGLSSGPAFFDALRRKGLRDNAFVVVMLLVAALLAIGSHEALGLGAGQTAGLFTGALTNTPALAGVLEYLKLNAAPGLGRETLDSPIVGYSIAYPIGVLGVITAIAVAQRLWRVDYRREAHALRDLGATQAPLVSRTIRVVRPDGRTESAAALAKRSDWQVRLVRLQRGDELSLVGEGTILRDGDRVSAIGEVDDVDRLTAFLGVEEGDALELDRGTLDFRRVFVSAPRVLARRIGDLDLRRRFGATVTRVRRGDIDFLATDDTVLEPGDRVRVVAPRERIEQLNEFFGDSYRNLSEIDVLTFSLGLVGGLLLGLLPVPLPGGGDFRLGIAGGPLLVALVVSKLDRTGHLVWSLPYGANITLRQFGLVLFLAGIGTRAGDAFLTTLLSRGGLALFASGFAITVTTAVLTLFIGYRLLKVSMSLLVGMRAGRQTNPAVLSYATEQTGNDVPNVGYATVYPVAMITKIILAQLLVALLA
ncbi:MAG: transporter [Gemmatimonadetes bacterium]|nr:transporter [Gemmatimonadota bacterium]